MTISDPIFIIQGSDDKGPYTPVRIVNWSDFVAAVAAQIVGPAPLSNVVTPETAFGQASNPGAGLNVSRGDHTHGTPAENDSPTLDEIQFNLAHPVPAFSEGLLFWDALDRTLAFHQGSGIGGVTQQIGQEQNIYVRNDSGVPIPNGSALYCTGSVGNRPSVALAQANSLTTAVVHMIATQDIAHNSNGFATTFGMIRNIDTQTPGWVEGDRLYLSATVAGGLQNTAPASGFTVPLGMVLKVSVGAGVIFAKTQNQQYMGNLLGGHYTQFEFDGTARAIGNAVCWRDELQSITNTRINSPAGDFELNDAEASVTAKTSARYPTDFLHTNLQLNHDWKPGTNAHIHIHWWQTQAGMPNWVIETRWQKQLTAKTTAWTPVAWAANEVAYVAGTLNQITEFPEIVPPVGYGQVSDILQVKLYRDVTNVSTLFGGAEAGLPNQELLHMDAHIQVDMLGSHEEYTK